MKSLAIILLIPFLLLGQTVTNTPVFLSKYMNATVLNGTSQYWTKSSPSNLDLNGAEMISNANNTGFETNLGDWANFGNHSALRSTVDKRTGTASMRITSSGAGDTTANFMYLPPSALGTMVAGNKYTVELWARSGTATSTITLNVGTQSATSGTLSTTFGTFTKVVFNFTALTSTDTLKIYANKAIDSLYVDDASLTQAYDAIVLVGLKSNTSGNFSSNERLFNYLPTGSAGYSIIAISGGGVLRGNISDGSTTVAPQNTAAVTDGKYHLASLSFARSGNGALWIDGVSGTGASITAVGKISGVTPLNIGVLVSSLYWNGNVASAQIARFSSLPSDDGASIIADAYNRFRQKRPFANSYPNGQVVAWYDWSSGGTDKSGNGNHLTPVASPTIIKVK